MFGIEERTREWDVLHGGEVGRTSRLTAVRSMSTRDEDENEMGKAATRDFAL